MQGPQPVHEPREHLPVQWKIAMVRDEKLNMTVVFPDPDRIENETFEEPEPIAG